jgi:HD-GYP domain-containing protein (c-di-GMP phosphodiesterase class II)
MMATPDDFTPTGRSGRIGRVSQPRLREYRPRVTTQSSSDQDEVSTAEFVAALSLATDLGMGFPLEHGLQSTLVAMRLVDALGADSETAFQTYYGCLLVYLGCTADAEIAAELFDEGALLEHFAPVMFGSPSELMLGIARGLGGNEGALPRKVLRAAGRLPRAVRGHSAHIVAMCEVSRILSDRIGMPPSVQALFDHVAERWDGKGEPQRLRGEAIPLAIRIIQVARDASFHRLLGDEQHVADVIHRRSGKAFDPPIADCLADNVSELCAGWDSETAWAATLAREPGPGLTLRGEAIDEALAAMGDFADLMSPYFAGHSSSVAELSARAAKTRNLPAAEISAVRRAAYVHDLGRVAVAAGVWQKPGPLSPDEWERVRLHAYYSERVIGRSTFLAPLSSIVSAHHERLDGSGYHRGSTAAVLTPSARLLAAADAFQTAIEPRPHRPALRTEDAADHLAYEASEGRLDPESVAAVLAVSGQRVHRITRPDGLSEREVEVLGLVARGLPTKQIGRALGISVKTADRHVQNAYAKIGVSSRAAATLYAMQNGLVAWGELPMVGAPGRS